MGLLNETKTWCSWVLAAAAVGAFGCANEVEVEPPCTWVVTPNECPTQETGGDDGVADADADANADPDAGPICVATPQGYVRTVHQCHGALSVSIAFDTILGDCAKTLKTPALCSELHSFGPGKDAYEMPAVMACCKPFDSENEDLYLQYCAADVIQQLCQSVPFRLQKYIDEGVFPIGKNQAQKLQNWLATAGAQQACYSTLYKPSVDENNPGQLGSASWLVNNGNNKDWKMLENFTVSINSAVVDTVSLPEDVEDQIACSDNNYNNTELFEDTIPYSHGITDIATMTNAGNAGVFGPVVLGGRVHGTGRLGSRANACQSPWCSTLEITADRAAGLWTLEELNLFASGAVTLSNGSIRINVDRAAIRLYHVGLGTIRPDRSGEIVHTLDARAASFVISGVGGSIYDLRWASNASPITARRTATGWSLDSFVIDHEDSKGQRWTVTVSPTFWSTDST